MKGVSSTYTRQIIFVIITLVYVFSRWITFKGFTGEDDLHYAMLATRVLHGQYTPFVAGDIFAGRVLLIMIQWFIYFIGGVSTYTTLMGTLITTVLCCYLTTFKLARAINATTVILSTALFYFNPVLTDSTLGVMPDIYVVLAGIIILLLWRNILNKQKLATIALNGVLIGSTAFLALFFKENALVFIPFVFCIALLDFRSKAINAGLIAIVTFSLLLVLAGWMYFHFTGNFFFRVTQIRNSNYSSPCNYELVGRSGLGVRLTYGVWASFISTGFYPVIFASLMILLRIVFDKSYHFRKDQLAIYLVILTVLSLYLPFSFKGYQPLCFKSRHFLFLLPLASAVSTSYVSDALKRSRILWLCIITSAILLTTCVLITGEKWYWMMYGLLLGYFLLQKSLVSNQLFGEVRLMMFAAVLWMYMPYRLFFMNSNWFQDLRVLATKVNGNYFYFPEHDNMMNWNLLHHFDSRIHSFNLGKNAFKPAALYYERLDTTQFHPGWFIVNIKFTQKSVSMAVKMDSLRQQKYFSKEISVGDVNAFSVDTPSQLSYLEMLSN